MGLTTWLLGRRAWGRLLIFCQTECPAQCREGGDGTRGKRGAWEKLGDRRRELGQGPGRAGSIWGRGEPSDLPAPMGSHPEPLPDGVASQRNVYHVGDRPGSLEPGQRPRGHRSPRPERQRSKVTEARAPEGTRDQPARGRPWVLGEAGGRSGWVGTARGTARRLTARSVRGARRPGVYPGGHGARSRAYSAPGPARRGDLLVAWTWGKVPDSPPRN